MKMRIKGNSIRIRLSKTEVAALTSGDKLEDSTSFGSNRFGYLVKPVSRGDNLYADYENGIINMYVPVKLLKEWPESTVTGFESHMKINDTEHLHLLLEKDFKCIDEVSEDQSDFFDNPAKMC